MQRAYKNRILISAAAGTIKQNGFPLKNRRPRRLVVISTALTIIIAILVFGFLIFIHEGGHYTAARIFKVSINEFAIGMGPKLFSRKSKKTGIAYSLRALPIGGFVSMVGEDEDSDDENAFCKKPVWQRIIITAAGALTNIIAGVVVMCIVVSMPGYTLASNTVADFSRDENGYSYAEAGGLAIGDRIVAVNGTPVHIGNELVFEIARKGVKPVDLTVVRDGERVVIEDIVFPTYTESGATLGDPDFVVFAEGKNVGTVLKHSFFYSASTIKLVWTSIYDLVTGRFGVSAVSGPVGVTQALGEAAKSGVLDLMLLAVVLSMNLGVMNLLPLPALDGGRLLFQLIELVRRKPIKREIEGYIHFGGLVVLMILMAVIAVKDIIGLF